VSVSRPSPRDSPILQTQFAQNILADESTYQLPLTTRSGLGRPTRFLRPGSAQRCQKSAGAGRLRNHALAFARAAVPHLLDPS